MLKRAHPAVTDYQYVVRLPADLGEALRERAAQEDRPISRILRQAIRSYLDSTPSPQEQKKNP